ncbi:hypothetical protein [uncultured Aquimarina sp.]|uniref:hypothetical protein n=1 Tax=uncultured Aquimarina sp. TaxID=575652 RepID=UPI0026028153|nr:hypothetical protein [uncultured Aquimarina sp.]
MKKLFFKQQKPLKIKILGILIFVLVGYLLLIGNSSLSQVLILLTIGVLLLGYSISYEVRVSFEVYRHLRFFNSTVYKVKKDLVFPEYISVFSALFTQDNEWGSVSALGTKEKHGSFVIRLFSENNKFTLFKTNNYETALLRAKELGELIDVEIYDATKS